MLSKESYTFNEFKKLEYETNLIFQKNDIKLKKLMKTSTNIFRRLPEKIQDSNNKVNISLIIQLFQKSKAEENDREKLSSTTKEQKVILYPIVKMFVKLFNQSVPSHHIIEDKNCVTSLLSILSENKAAESDLNRYLCNVCLCFKSIILKLPDGWEEYKYTLK